MRGLPSTTAQRRPGERPGNRGVRATAGQVNARSTKAGRKARQPHPIHHVALRLSEHRSTKAGRKARQPLSPTPPLHPGKERSTKAGRKARQPHHQQRNRDPECQDRSTKAGRKARQPPAATRAARRRRSRASSAQRRPGERPGNRPRESPPHLETEHAQRRPGERPGNRFAGCQLRAATSPTLNEGRAKGPATARSALLPLRSVGPRSTKAGRKARQPRSGSRRSAPGTRPLNEGRAKGPATARCRGAHLPPRRENAQRRPGERPGNRRILHVGFPSMISAQRRPGERPGNRDDTGLCHPCATRAQRRPGERPGNRVLKSLVGWVWHCDAQRRPGERPGNRFLRPRSDSRARSAQRRPGERPGNRRVVLRSGGSPSRTLNEGRAKGPATAIDDDVIGPRLAALNEGRAKGPATALHFYVVLGRAAYRSTKAGRKARQPRERHLMGDARCQPLNEGRAKGPATAHTDPTPTQASSSIAQRRPGERPGNRIRGRGCAGWLIWALNEGRAKGPATARCGNAAARNSGLPRSTKAGRKARQPPRRRLPPQRSGRRALNEGRAKGPATAGRAGRLRRVRRSLNEGRAKGPATASGRTVRPSGGRTRSTKAGRKARQPLWLRLCAYHGSCRSTKAGRKARQPLARRQRQARHVARSTKAGRKARQPRRAAAASRGRGASLNEGRAKGPATATVANPVHWSYLAAQRRPGERPGNRW